MDRSASLIRYENARRHFPLVKILVLRKCQEIHKISLEILVLQQIIQTTKKEHKRMT